MYMVLGIIKALYGYFHIGAYNSIVTFVENFPYYKIEEHWNQYYSLYIAGFSGLLLFGIVLLVLRGIGALSMYKKMFIQNMIDHTDGQESVGIQRMQTIIWLKIPVLNGLYRAYMWANIPIPFGLYLVGGLVLAVCLYLFCMLFGMPAILAFTIALLVYGTYMSLINIFAAKNQAKVTEQLPFVLDTMSGALQSGYSLRQAFIFTKDEIEPPIRTLFEEGVKELNYNIPLDEVFESMQNRTDNAELIMVLDGLILQNRMGGNVVEMLNKMAEWVRQKDKLIKSIKVFTAQGRMSGIMLMLLWPASAFMFYQLSPEYIMIMVETLTGQILLLVSILLEVVGFIMIWKIIKIKV